MLVGFCCFFKLFLLFTTRKSPNDLRSRPYGHNTSIAMTKETHLLVSCILQAKNDDLWSAFKCQLNEAINGEQREAKPSFVFGFSSFMKMCLCFFTRKREQNHFVVLSFIKRWQTYRAMVIPIPNIKKLCEQIKQKVKLCPCILMIKVLIIQKVTPFNTKFQTNPNKVCLMHFSRTKFSYEIPAIWIIVHTSTLAIPALSAPRYCWNTHRWDDSHYVSEHEVSRQYAHN